MVQNNTEDNNQVLKDAAIESILHAIGCIAILLLIIIVVVLLQK
jgi:hypothetical protein